MRVCSQLIPPILTMKVCLEVCGSRFQEYIWITKRDTLNAPDDYITADDYEGNL